MIFPILSKFDNTVYFNHKLSLADKHVYNCLYQLSEYSAGFTIKDLLRIVGNGLDEPSLFAAIKNLEKAGIIFIRQTKDETGRIEHVIVSYYSPPPKVTPTKIKMLQFLDSKPLFRDVVFHYLSTKTVIKRMGPVATTFFPTSNIRGGEILRIEQNFLTFAFAHKHIDQTESYPELFHRLKMKRINLKKLSIIIIEALGRIAVQIADQKPAVALQDYLEACQDTTKRALCLFLAGCVHLAAEVKDPAKFFIILEKLSKAKPKEMEKKKEKTELKIKENPKLDPKYVAIFDYWNTKNLKKHRDYNAKLISNAAKLMKRFEKGTFNEDKIRYNTDDFYASIDALDSMANDPNVKPTGLKQKDFLKKLSIEDFFFSNYTGISTFISIMNRGSQTLVSPYSEDVFSELCRFTESATGNKLSSKNMNFLASFLNSTKDFYDIHKKRIEFDCTVLKLCKAIIRSITKGGKWLNFLFLVSEEMKLNVMMRVAIEEGYILGTGKTEQTVIYQKSPIHKKVNVATKTESEAVKRRRELIRETKEGKFRD